MQPLQIGLLLIICNLSFLSAFLGHDGLFPFYQRIIIHYLGRQFIYPQLLNDISVASKFHILHLYIFAFVFCAFSVISKKSCQKQCHKGFHLFFILRV